MALIYSTRFIANPGGPDTVSYTVPSGQVAVLRSISIFVSDSGQYANLLLTSPEVYVVFFQATANNQTFSWTGRQVLNAGETIQSFCSASGTTLMASGYLLNSAL